LACARLDEIGKAPTVILSKVGLTPEEAQDPAVRLDIWSQIELFELAAEEVQDEWLGFHLARSFDLREIGLVYYVMASSNLLYTRFGTPNDIARSTMKAFAWVSVCRTGQR
jgi:hypothetical protein